MSQSDELITIGKILKPFGVRGAVKVHALTDVPGRLENLAQVVLVTEAGEHIAASVTEVRRVGPSYLVKFSAFHNPEEARKYRGAWMKIPRGSAPPLPAGTHYQFELIGLQVVDERGREIGVLEEVIEQPSAHVFVVRKGAEEVLVPGRREIVKQVDCQANRMIIAPLETWTHDHAV